MTKSSNQERRHSTSKMLQAKLDELRRFRRDGIPKGYKVPLSMTMLRHWTDENLNLQKISSPKITNRKLSPHNAALIDQIELELRSLSDLKAQSKVRKSPSLSQQIVKAISERDEARYAAGRYLSQIQELSHELQSAVILATSAQEGRDKANQTIAELNRELSKLRGKKLHLI